MDMFSGDLCPERPEPWRCPALASLVSLLEKIPALLWATDTEPRFTSLTGAGLHAAGLAAEDLRGQPVAVLFADAKERALAAHRTALEGVPCSLDIGVNGHDYNVHLEPLRAQDGGIVGVIGVALEDTERLVAQRAVHLSEQNHRSLIEEAPYAICRVTESGQLLQVNRAMLDMLGYAAGAEADLLVRDLPFIFDSADAFDAFRSALLNAHTVQGVDSTWTSQSGRKIQVRVGGRAVRAASGEIVYLDVFAENVTERRLLKAQLSQAKKMQAIGQLAGGVAHDFNNLLTVIGGQVELLLETAMDSKQWNRLRDVQQATARASALTRQLLTFGRKQLSQSRTLDLNQVIAEMSSMLGRLFRENIELNFVSGPDLAYVRADPNEIEQVLMNLTLNAQDAMPQGGRISIETSTVRIDSTAGPQSGVVEPGDYVSLTVTDNGHGMDPEIQAHLFEPFFTTKKTGEGTGLGLATVYGIVKQSGGQIQVESRPGAGSVFRILLPRVLAAEPADVEPLPTGPLASARGLETVLLAEDEKSLRELVTAYLRQLGYCVLTASNGEGALQLARSHHGTIDLLLSDFVMPKMGGRDLASELRKTNPGLRVVFVSGYAGHGTERELSLPNTRFLSKPFSMQDLARTVRGALDSADQTL